MGEEMPLFSTAFANGDTFVEIFRKAAGNVEDFLHRNDYIAVRGTAVLPYELSYIHASPDIDGVVIEWKDLTGCTLELTHLQIVPKGVMSLKSFFPILKKHLELQKFTTAALEMLKVSMATQLFYTDGWETWFGLIPKRDCRARYSREVVRNLTLRALIELRTIFQRKMKEGVKGGRMVNTGAKNNLSDLSKMFVLPDDREEVVAVMESSIHDTCIDISNFRKCVVTFRFGDKRQVNLPLPIVGCNRVARISVHSGLSLKFCFTEKPVSHLFWCREGVQMLVGNRGILSGALSFSECVNYQSNLDGRSVSVCRELREICKYPDELTFIQFYSDIPHRYPKTRMHPVSAAVMVLKGLLKERRHLEKDAASYVEEIENNIDQVGRCIARMEMVVAIPAECKLVEVNEVVDLVKVRNLLTNYPLLVPFIHPQLSSIIRGVGQYLVDILKRHLGGRNGTGDSHAVWECYQAELALEKLLWGRPLCGISALYSVNLGPGTNYPSRSSTDAMGFLCLEDSGSCCVDEFTTPPLSIYSTNRCLSNQISKTFGLINSVACGNVVVGRRVVSVCLRDLYDIGKVFCRFEEFQMGLMSNSNATIKVVGGSARKRIANMIAGAKKAKFPMVIVHMLDVLKDIGVDVPQVLETGIRELQLKYFPALRLYDEQRNAGLSWQWQFGVWVITDISTVEVIGDDNRILYTLLVVKEVEEKKLFHSSVINGRNLPWIKPTIEKVADMQLSQEDLTTVLTFVTCVARLMQGCYVDYQNLYQLERSLPLTQFHLRQREILSKLMLPHFTKFRLRRLHHSIPIQTVAENTGKNREVLTVNKRHDAIDTEPNDINEPPNKIQAVDAIVADEGRHQNVIVAPVRHIPTTSNSRWSSLELGIVGTLKMEAGGIADHDIYQLYQRKCASYGIPDRSFDAFRRKLNRN